MAARPDGASLGSTSYFSADADSRRIEAGEEDAALSFDDVAVLYRTNAQAAPLVEALERAGIPFQKRSHERLMARDDVRLLVHALESGDDRLAPFLRELVLGAEVDTWDPRAERVSLLTLHAAKGLEFPVVFTVRCDDGLLPLTWTHAEDVDEAEERRLFFVGMTRARRRLVLTRARRRHWRDELRKTRPSPFLREIEESPVERRQTEARRRPPSAGDQLRLL